MSETATLLYSLLCLVLSPSQSFTHQTHYSISPSHIHQQQQHQLILSLSCHHRLSHSPSRSRNWNSLPSLILFARPEACAPFRAFSFHTLSALSSFYQLSSLTEPVAVTCILPAEGDASLPQHFAPHQNDLLLRKRPRIITTDLKHPLNAHLHFQHSFNLSSSLQEQIYICGGQKIKKQGDGGRKRQINRIKRR